jgi:choline dehydrogenase-like flavoprotein
MPESYDIIIVGAGSAGCVLAGKLSEAATLRVLLIEAGPPDKNFLISMPKGSGKILSKPEYCHYFPTSRDQLFPGSKPEMWARGKVLGGSSAVNGMVYHRGAPEDFDRFVELGLAGWGWSDMLPYFLAIEDHELPATEFRGKGGPMHLSVQGKPTRLSAAMIDAAKSIGLPYKEDPNLPQPEGIAYIVANISARGKRVSAATAFLPPAVKRRPNLTIKTGVTVQRILFDGKRAVGVAALTPENDAVEFRAGVETIICAGAIQSPQLLQVSGIGPAALLGELGVPVIHDSPGVGGNLREHYLAFLQFHLKHASDSENREYGGWRLGKNVLQYLLTGGGLMAQSPWHMSAFVRALPESTRPDSQLTFAPFSLDFETLGAAPDMDKRPGMQLFGYPSRATSQGTIQARSTDMRMPPKIDPNYLDTEYDKSLSVGLVNYIRRFMKLPALAPYVEGETDATAYARSDDEILDLMRNKGQTGYHANGTVRMGVEETAPLDERLRVRGVTGLRVMDASVFPEQVSANTNAPIMAMAWRAADLILADHNHKRTLPIGASALH